MLILQFCSFTVFYSLASFIQSQFTFTYSILIMLNEMIFFSIFKNLDKDIFVPNKTDNSSYVYTISNGSVISIDNTFNGTDYLSANKSCQTYGGYLTVIDTQDKQNNIQKLIRTFFSTFSIKKASFLIGIKFSLLIINTFEMSYFITLNNLIS